MDEAEGGVPRRRFLAALALAPAAGCAAGGAERRPDGAGRDGAQAGGAEAAPAAATVAAVRAWPVAPDAEPAFVFRAAAARPGDGR
jgi:hypothetical protein